MRLIYLGQAFECSARPAQTYLQPSAVNWRYQIPGGVYGEKTLPDPMSSTPKVVSWRWQVPNV